CGNYATPTPHDCIAGPCYCWIYSIRKDQRYLCAAALGQHPAEDSVQLQESSKGRMDVAKYHAQTWRHHRCPLGEKMLLTRFICIVLFLLGVLKVTWAQLQDRPPAEPYAVGTVFGPENPAVTSLEEATPNAEARSFLKPGLHFSESLNSNGG